MQYKFRHLFTGVLFFIFVVSGAVMFTGARASAQVTFTSDQAQFLADNPRLAFQNFDNSLVQPNAVILCPSPANASSDNNCFLPGTIRPGIEFTNDPSFDPLEGISLIAGNFLGPGIPLGNALTNTLFTDNFDILFNVGVRSVGLTLGCYIGGACSQDIVVSVYAVGGDFLGSKVVHVTTAFDTFLGLNSTTSIGEISLGNIDVNSRSAKGVLKVWFGDVERNIPTLSEWGMISAAAGLMLVGVFFAARKRLRASKQSDAIG